MPVVYRSAENISFSRQQQEEPPLATSTIQIWTW